MFTIVKKKEEKKPEIALGDVVAFPAYNTIYLVHTADTSAKEKYGYPSNAMQLVRTDGKKPYRNQPFSQEELQALVTNLGGEVYSQKKYNFTLTEK